MTDFEFLAYAPFAQGETHVWWMHRDGEIGRAVEGALPFLPAGERRTYERYRFADRRVEFAAGRLLARTVLGVCLSSSPALVNFRTDAYGKPFLDGPSGGYFFNISHSGGLVVCAVSHTQVGVDVEKADVERFDVMPLVFSLEEIQWVEKQVDTRERLRSFYVAWTRKEAAMKAIGRGFSLPATSLAVPLGEEAGSSRTHDFSTFEPVAGFIVAVATARSDGPATSCFLHEVPSRQFAEAVARQWPSPR